MSGNYTCATIEHFAAFAPAFGRRPFIFEQNLSLVVATDYSLAGAKLTLSTTIGGVPLSGEIVGGGYAKLEFPMPHFAHEQANFSETVNITLTLPDGRSRANRDVSCEPHHRRSGCRPARCKSTMRASLLMDGVRKTAMVGSTTQMVASQGCLRARHATSHARMNCRTRHSVQPRTKKHR